MTWRVVFRVEAEDDLMDTQDWYERRQAGLGSRFADAVADCVMRIAENPLGFPLIHGDVRRAVVPRFGYVVYFSIETEVLLVWAVHGRQSPRRWQMRRAQAEDGG